MLEIVQPCPRCQTPLLIDEENAGTEVLCPGCGVHLVLPRELSGAEGPVVFEEVRGVRVEEELGGEAAGRKVFRLNRSGPVTLGEGVESVAVDPLRVKGTALPTRRGVESGEAMRLLAAMAVAPGQGEGEEGERRAKTVLPERRQVEDLAGGEQVAAGRPKREGGHLPPPRHAIGELAAEAAERAGVSAGPVEPIPARGDAEFSVTLPTVRREGGRPATGGGTLFAGSDRAVEGRSRGPRVAPERRPAFSPRHEADMSPEHVGEWGGSGDVEERPASLRRAASIAVAVLLLAGAGVGLMIAKGTFGSAVVKTAAGGVEEEPSREYVDAASAALTRFFNADTIEVMAKEVRHPEVTVERMRRYYASQLLTPRKIAVSTDWQEVSNFEGSGMDFAFTTIEADAVKGRQVWLELPRDGGAPRIDWEHLVSWSEVSWTEFVTGSPEGPGEFRVTVSPADKYEGAFPDKFRYMAFRMSDPEKRVTCYGYCESDSEVARQLLAECRQARRRGEVNEDGEGEARCILRLRPVPDGKRFAQVGIEAFVWKSWVQP
jgi:hypothetical protein